ncbi:MAG TPA: M23 family metallopeptidase [Candidatus Acidoferrum sp.]|nr:M23 family metallopeptidase [Candidatus Acidoferrum sp.]
MRWFVLVGAVAAFSVPGPSVPDAVPFHAARVQIPASDYFQYPLPTWEPHCLGFGSEWRLCNGAVLRACASGAVWLHTGVDITSGIQPVMAAADGVIAGYIVDPTFLGGVLIRHATSQGIVLTQYWHVWPRPGFRVGTAVKRGQVFADVADMGSRTHLHFAVFMGDFESHAWNGALPPTSCSGFPAFPYHFVDPNAFIQAHLPFVAIQPRVCRLNLDQS